MNPQVPSGPVVYPPVQNTIPQVRHKSSCLKKLLLGILIFIVFIIVLIVALIFIVPMVLSLTAKDISFIDDKDILPAIIKVPVQDNAFFDLIDIKADQPEVALDYITLKKWDDNDIAQILDKNKLVFAKWDSAAKKANFQDPFYQDSTTPAPYQPNYPHLYSDYQKSARLNTLRGLNQIKQGSSSAGLDTINEILNIGQKMQHSGNGLIGVLVGTSIKTIGFQGLQTAIGKLKLSPTMAALLSRQLDLYSFDTEGLKEGFKHEYFAQAYIIDSLASGQIDKIYPADSTDSATIALKNKLKGGIKNDYMFQPNKTKLLIANFYRMQIKNVDNPCDNINLLVSQKKAFTASNIVSLYFKENAIGEILSSLGAIPFDGVINSKCTQQIELDATKLLIALHAYRLEKGSMPNSLDQLVPAYISSIPVDPYDGKPLKYSPSNKTIYSVGKDKRDDGGAGKVHDSFSTDYIVPVIF